MESLLKSLDAREEVPRPGWSRVVPYSTRETDRRGSNRSWVCARGPGSVPKVPCRRPDGPPTGRRRPKPGGCLWDAPSSASAWATCCSTSWPEPRTAEPPERSASTRLRSFLGPSSQKGLGTVRTGGPSVGSSPSRPVRSFQPHGLLFPPGRQF